MATCGLSMFQVQIRAVILWIYVGFLGFHRAHGLPASIPASLPTVPTPNLASIAVPTISGTGLRTLPRNFTLAAINITLPNANRTGAPLVLGAGGATGGASLHVTSTYASFPYNDFPALSLVDGQLRAFGRSGNWITNATTTSSGGMMNWLTSTIYHTSPTDYSVFPKYGLPYRGVGFLGVHDRLDLWSLCPSKQFRGQTSVVFNISAAPPNQGYDEEDCYGVLLNVVPVLPDFSEAGIRDLDE